MGEFAIGQGVPRFEDPRLVRGAGHYTDDVQLPGMAYGVALRSQHAHAKINAIDTTAAMAAPGVLAVITAADWKAAGLGDLPSHSGLKRPGGGPMVKPRYTVLAEDCVRWVGDPVAFVVADTLAQAQDAADLIQADYQELPAVTSTADAAKPGSPRVYDDCPDNISFMEPIGDKAGCDAGFAKAAHVVKHRLIVNRITAVTMEPRGAVARFDRGDGRYTVYGATQRPHGFRAELANILRVHETAVHVITGDTGGSFGMKTPVFNEIPLVCHAARLTGRPVKWISTRTEAFLSDAQGRDNVTDAELALDAAGHFLALRVKTTAAIGAYLQNNMPAFFLNAGSLAGPYRTPAIYVEATGVFTNTNPVRPYRGNGRPEAAFVMERMVELAARAKNRSNRIAAAQLHQAIADAVQDRADLHLRLRRVRKEHGPRRAACRLRRLRETQEGRAQARKAFRNRPLQHHRTRRGARHRRRRGALRQIRRGDDVCRIEQPGPGPRDRVQADRRRPARHPPRRHPLRAGRHRSGVLRRRHRRLALGHYGRLGLRQGDRQCDRESDRDRRACAAGRISRRQIRRRRVLLGQDQSHHDDEGDRRRRHAAGENSRHHGTRACRHRRVQSAGADFPNGCHICEVEIDKETGETQIVRYSVVDDVGTVLNPMLLHGQIHGGIAQGAGQVLMEDIHFDAGGQLVTASFMDYAMPRAHNLSAMHVESNPVPTKTNPLGTKGAGEAGCVGALPAVVNAVVDGLAEFGVTHIEMPATPERIWRAMNKA